MAERVILILADGMRPDALTSCGHPFVEKMKEMATYTLGARTVIPSITLPCHVSLFHSVDPARHGTEMPEDMTIPLFFMGPRFEKGKVLPEGSIKDVAPTVAALLDCEPAEEWEGTARV